MRKLGFALAVIVSLAAIAAVGTAGAAWLFRDKETVRYAVGQPVERVAVEGTGDIEVVATKRSSISVERISTSFIDEPESSWKVVDGVLLIESHCGDDWAFFAHCSIDYRVEIPVGTPLEIDTAHGDVDVRGAIGDVRVESKHGDIDVRGATVDVYAESDHGDVEVDLDEPATTLEARSDHGDIDVSVPTGEYRVEASTDHGDTRVDGIVRDAAAARSILARSGHGDVEVRGR